MSPYSALIASAKTIAVVGLSNRPDRPSFTVASAMQRGGYRIIPVNPNHAGTTILGQLCVASLGEIEEQVDIVDCFRRSEDMEEVATTATAMAKLPKVLWMQVGVASDKAAAIAARAGMTVVQNECLQTHYRSSR